MSSWLIPLGLLVLLIVLLIAFSYFAARTVELMGLDPYYNDEHPEVRPTKGAERSDPAGPLLFAFACIAFVVIGAVVLI